MSHCAKLATCLLVIGSACSSAKPTESPGPLDGRNALDEAAAPSATASPAGSPPGASAELAPIIVETSGSPAPGDAALTASSAAVVETLFVRDVLVDCQGESAQKCLQVRGSASEEWRNFYAPIDGFEHEAAHAYELRVEVTKVAHAPADAPSLRYRLLEVVSKRNLGKK